ncbi:ECF transporter S component [Candidatus Bathyarchaeota archaeon]|nr:ECF transporter S component [Candidatus Bathyarchaeota archaeon]
MMKTKTLALSTILAALYAACSFLPGFPVIGVSGSKIDIVRAFDIFYGIILGPFYGPLAAFLGSFTGKFLSGGGFSIFLTPLAPITAFVAAGLYHEKIFGIKGWILSSSISTILIIGWFFTEVGRGAPFYPIPHIIGLIMMILFKNRNLMLFNSNKSEMIPSAIYISLSSTLTGHMLGNLIFLAFFDTTSTFFMGLLPISIIERSVITIITTILIVSSLRTIYKLYPELVNN